MLDLETVNATSAPASLHTSLSQEEFMVLSKQMEGLRIKISEGHKPTKDELRSICVYFRHSREKTFVLKPEKPKKEKKNKAGSELENAATKAPKAAKAKKSQLTQQEILALFE